MTPSITNINEKGIKGLLLLGLSKKEREDIIDFIELSSPASQRESEQRVREKAEHLSMKEVHASLRKTDKNHRK